MRKALGTPLSLTAVSMAGGEPFQLRVSADPNRTCVIEVATNLAGWSAIVTNTTSANGTFDYTDEQSSGSTQRSYRAMTSP